jgi:hypothetical protein
MATETEVLSLRRATGLDTNDPTYTYEVLAGIIDDLGSVEAAAGAVWTEKAASFAGVVDTTESGSTRRLSQLHQQALAMRQTFVPSPDDETEGRSFTVGIERV